MSHAVLSASGTGIWTICHPSVRFGYYEPDTKSEYSEEGTLAHSIAELMIKFQLGRITKEKYTVELTKYQRHEKYQKEMYHFCKEFCTFVIRKYNEVLAVDSTAIILLETKLDLSKIAPESFGTVDVLIIGAGKLIIIDLKYGKGVPVSAIKNMQLSMYGLGGLYLFDCCKDIRTVELNIAQPRLDDYSVYTLDRKDLIDLGSNVIRPAALKAWHGEGDFIPGKHCLFCKGKAVCKARLEWLTPIVDMDFMQQNRMQDSDIVMVLERASALRSWLKAVEEYALAQAIKGKKYQGFKLTNGRSNRTFISSSKVIDALRKAGYNDDEFFETKLMALTALEKLLGKHDFDEVLGRYVDKPNGAPTLKSITENPSDYTQGQPVAKLVEKLKQFNY